MAGEDRLRRQSRAILHRKPIYRWKRAVGAASPLRDLVLWKERMIQCVGYHVARGRGQVIAKALIYYLPKRSFFIAAFGFLFVLQIAPFRLG